jgi:hypothetical protein
MCDNKRGDNKVNQQQQCVCPNWDFSVESFHYYILNTVDSLLKDITINYTLKNRSFLVKLKNISVAAGKSGKVWLALYF